MSAFRVSKTHVDAMLTAALSSSIGRRRGSQFRWGWETGQPKSFDTTPPRAAGQMLLDENAASVNSRYNEQENAEPYSYQQLPGVPDPKIVINAVRCYEYQSSEHPGWQGSEARMFCDALTHACLGVLTASDDTWEINDRDVFLKKAVAERTEVRKRLAGQFPARTDGDA